MPGSASRARAHEWGTPMEVTGGLPHALDLAGAPQAGTGRPAVPAQGDYANSVAIAGAPPWEHSTHDAPWAWPGPNTPPPPRGRKTRDHA